MKLRIAPGPFEWPEPHVSWLTPGQGVLADNAGPPMGESAAFRFQAIDTRLSLVKVKRALRLAAKRVREADREAKEHRLHCEWSERAYLEVEGSMKATRKAGKS
jgi:hypothetical protein